MDVNEPTDPQSGPPPKKFRLQFGLKHLLAFTVAVALFSSCVATLGLPLAVYGFLGLSLLAVAVWPGKTRAERVCISVVGLIWLAFMLPTVDSCRYRPRLPRCMHHLKQIALALHNYHDAHKCFPPAYIADENGRPIHSWRVFILPYLDQQSLYNQYRFDEPWDGPNNRRLADIAVKWFNCPEEHDKPSTMTSYVVVVGPQTAWPGGKSTKLQDFKDGTSNTLLVVEVKNSGIRWMEPRDLHFVQMAPGVNPTSGQGISSQHQGGANVAMADGSVQFLPEDTPPEVLRALLSIASGETIDADSL